MGDVYFDLKDKTDELFKKYMQESKLMKWLNNSYYKAKSHAFGIIILVKMELNLSNTPSYSLSQ